MENAYADVRHWNAQKKKRIRKTASEELNKVSPLITAARVGLRQEKP